MSLKNCPPVVMQAVPWFSLPVFWGCLLCLFLAGVTGRAADISVLDFAHEAISRFQSSQVRLAIEQDTLTIAGLEPASVGSVLFPIPENRRDLSGRRFLEVEVENTGAHPLRFTFWALSGNGWGGSSTWTTRKIELIPGKPKPQGFETLLPGKRQKFAIDLHARYPGPDAMTKAINPAAIRWLRIIVGDGRNVPSLRLRNIIATGAGPAEPHDISKRILVPEVERGQAAAGKRVYQQLPGWEKTRVTHVLTLPKNWRAGQRYPMIVEYTGNIFYDKFCHSTGLTDQGNMAYGLSRGEKYICLNLPFISEDGQREQENSWGSPDKTVAYCLQAIRHAAEHFGGDANAVFYTGFSRGSIAANYIALRNDEIARVWLGFIGTNPGTTMAPGVVGWQKSEIGWNERAARLKGRPCIVSHPSYGYGVHVDVEYLEDSPSTLKTRAWMDEVLRNPAQQPR